MWGGEEVQKRSNGTREMKGLNREEALDIRYRRKGGKPLGKAAKARVNQQEPATGDLKTQNFRKNAGGKA